MRWDITLRDPQSQIPDLILNTFGEEGYQRSLVQQITLREFSQPGAALLNGTVQGYRFTWQIAVQITDTQALHLEALITAQQLRYANFDDGHLLLIDEVEYLPPEPAPHSRTLIAGSALTVVGRSTGFGQFKVLLTLSEVHRKHLGVTEPDQVKLMQFGAVELP